MIAETRFTTLDGLRGLAAILVMCFHAGPASPLRVDGGYLAVDVFFALSGFVLTMTYEPRLRDGMSFRRFALLRLSRLYPMYFIGMLPAMMMGWASFTALLMLPNVQFTGALFPENTPMWSLFFELLVSLAFGLLAVRTNNKALACIVAACGTLLLIQTIGVDKPLGRGPDWPDFALGLTRTAFSFAVGVAIYRARQHFSVKSRITWMAVLPFVLLLAALMISPTDRQVWDLACVFGILPLIVWMGTVWEMPWPKLGSALGDMSYPLYCIHAPIIWGGLHGLPNMATQFALIILIAWALDRCIDRPLRRQMKTAINTRRAIPAIA